MSTSHNASERFKKDALIRRMQADKRKRQAKTCGVSDSERAKLIQDFKDKGGSITAFLNRELIDGACNPTKALRNSERGLPKDTFDP